MMKKNLIIMAMVVGIVAVFLMQPVASTEIANKSSISSSDKILSDLVIEKVNQDPEPDYGEKRIEWNSFYETFNNTWTWEQSEWLFGPTPSYTLTFENGTPIKRLDPIQPGVNGMFVVDINIPMDALAGAEFGEAGFYLDYYTENYSLSGSYGYRNTTWSPGEWFSWAYEYNQSNPWGPPADPTIFVFNEPLRSATFNSASNSWNIHIVGYIDNSVMLGRWNFGLFVRDINGNNIGFGYSSWDSASPPWRELFIGEVDQTFGGQDGYFRYLKTPSGDPISTLKREAPFNAGVNVSASNDLEYVRFRSNLPDAYVRTVNVTDYFENTSIIQGGWVYDPILKTYVYNSSLEVEQTETVYGKHEVTEEVWIDHSVQNGEFWGYEEFFIFAFPNGSFIPKIGYSYWDNINFENVWVYRDPDPNEPTENLLKLNSGTWTEVALGKYDINFNLEIDGAVKQGQHLYFGYEVVDVTGMYYWNIDQEYTDYTVYVESPIAKTTIYNEKGPVKFDALRVKDGESFRVVSKLEGYDSDSDLQAASFVLQGWDSKWTPEFSRWSELQIVIRYDFIKDKVIIEAYNSTNREYLAEGEYLDWIYSEKVGFHWEYNLTSGEYDWINGTYYEWEYTTVYGQYWTHQYFNQSSQTWEEGWISQKNPANKIGDNDPTTPYPDVIGVNDASVSTIDGQLVLNINVSILPNTPQARYNFRVQFETYEFKQDWEAGYGPTTSMMWLEEPIPKIETSPGVFQYVDVVPNPLYLEYAGAHYLINERPYIQIDKSFEFLRTFKEYNMNNQEEREFLVNQKWNPATGESQYYYTLENGTQVFIEEGTGARIFHIRLNTTDALNNTEFHSFQRFADEKYYWQDSDYLIDYTFYLINGTKFVITRDYYSDTPLQSAGFWDQLRQEYRYNNTEYYLLNTTFLLVADPVNILPLYLWDGSDYDLSIKLEVQDGWPQWDWRINKYYVIDAVTGARLYFERNSTWDNGDWHTEYVLEYNSVIYTVFNGPWDIWTYYYVDYDGETLEVPEWYARQIYYVDGLEQISLLPTKNLPAQSYWELENTITNGGLVPTAKSVTMNGVKINLVKTPSGWELRFAANGSLMNKVPLSSVKNDRYLLRINGQEVWNATHTGYTIEYGKFNFKEYKFIPSGEFNAKTREVGGAYLPDYDYVSYEFGYNATDGTEIRSKGRSFGALYQVRLNISSTPVIVNETNSYGWNSVYNMYELTDINGIKYLSEDYPEFLDKYLFPIIEGVGDQFVDYYGVLISLSDWYDWGMNTDYYYTLNIDGQEFVFDKWNGEYLYDNTYNYTYGTPAVPWGIDVVGWFLMNLSDGGNYYYTSYNALYNHTTDETIRVDYMPIAVFYKVLVNDSIYINVTQPYFNYIYDPNGAGLLYMEFSAWNGTKYRVVSQANFFIEEEYHIYGVEEDDTWYFWFNGVKYEQYADGIQWNYQWAYVAEIDGVKYELENSYNWEPIIEVPLPADTYIVDMSKGMIQKRISHYGYPYRYMYVPDWQIQTRTTVWEIVIGNPRTNMWGYDAWTVNPDNGAIDLDADLDTTDDQYYVRRVWTSTDSYIEEYSRLYVNTYWDPSVQTYSNEYNLNSWMGFNTVNTSWQWSELYYWYHADDLAQLTEAEMQNVQDTVMNGDEPAAGYWGLSWMVYNTTWEDMLADAQANGWDWFDNTHTYTWLDFGFSQNYYTYLETNDTAIWSSQSMRNEWSGLWLYNDTNDDGVANFGNDEVTHVFVPEGIGNLEFTTPGINFGNFNDTGSIYMKDDSPLFNTTVDFGVQFLNVTGATIPTIKDIYGQHISYWDWYSVGALGSEYNSFASRPTDVSINEIAFQLHFNVETAPGAPNANATLKLDQTIGNWNVDFTGGRSNLANYSLAISYFTELQSSSYYEFKNGEGSPVQNDQVVVSDSFSFGGDGAEFASAILRGDYIWGKNTSKAVESTSYTMPITQFQSVYQSESGSSSVGFTIDSQMYFMAIGFPSWDGFSVFQDPTYSAVSAVGGSSTNPADSPTITSEPMDSEFDEGTNIQLNWRAEDSDPDYYEIVNEQGTVLASGSWLSGVDITYVTVVFEGDQYFQLKVYDDAGNSRTGRLVKITGRDIGITVTTNPTGTTGTGGTTTTGPIVTVSTTDAGDNTQPTPGFTIEALLFAVVIIAPVIVLRRRKE